MKAMMMVMFSFCSQYLFSQTQPQLKADTAKLSSILKDERFADLLKRYHQSYQPDNTARYSHKGLGGYVYQLPIDNMPCLRPDTGAYVYNEPRLLLKETQPFSFKNGTKLIQPAPGNTMPNAYRGKPLFWGK